MAARTSLTILAASLFCVAAWSQGISSINGTITDPSGAVIPGVRITATEVDTGLTRETVSSVDGIYVLSALRPTSYTLSVAVQGFRQFNQTGLTLQADATVTINIKLEVGAANESVSVDAVGSQVDTTSATLKQVVDSARIVELPLNGRNAASLTTLVAGAVSAPSGNTDMGSAKTFPGAVVPLSVNGGRSNNVVFNLDGVRTQDVMSNVNQPLPMPDALQEFGFQTGNFSAEYGQNSSGVVNVVTKSGTNTFHGDAFEFVRNGVFNARNFFASTVDPLKRNQYGGDIGGPIKKDKLFFFAGYQGTRIRSTQGGLSAYVPTAANLNGDFSSLLSATNPANPLRRAVQLIDPTNKQPFPNNKIPTNRFDSSALKVLPFLPASQNPNGQVFFSTPVVQNYDEFITRIDYSLSGSDRFNYRFNKNWYDQPGIFANNNLLTYALGTPDTSYNTALQETHIFSPTLLNDARFAVTRVVTTRHPPPGTPNMTDFGVQNMYQSPTKAIEGFTVSGLFAFGGLGESVFPRTTFDWYDTLRWVKGRHSLAIGGAFERARFPYFTKSVNGTFAFSGDLSGYAMSDFLLGRVRTFTQAGPSYQNDRNYLYSLFTQDTYKANSRLTLNFGIRWEPSFPWHDLYGQAEAFSPALYAQGVRSQVFTKAYPGEIFTGDSGFPFDGRLPSYNNFTPRFGFAYDPFGDGKTSIRGGTGIFQNAQQPAFSNNPQVMVSPYTAKTTITNLVGPFSNPYQGITNPYPTTFPTAHDFVFPTPVTVSSWDTGHYKIQTTTVYNWNLTIERELRRDWLVRGSYVAARTNHLPQGRQLNASIYIPGSTLGTDARRPFQPFSSIIQAGASADAWYNSMQLSLEKRLSHGFTILANYTWSKSNDNMPLGADVTTLTSGLTKPWNSPGWDSLDRGPSDFDFNHNLVVSYVWQLPALSHSNALLRTIAGGWQIAGITIAQSGGPLTILAGLDRSLSGIGSDKVDLVSSNIYQSGACANVAPCMNYLIPGAFQSPALGSYGSLAKGALRGPGMFNTDAGVHKTFPIKERLNFQFRAEFFNLFNHTNFINPFSSSSAGYTDGSRGAALNGAGFGTLRASRDPRIGQLALKVIF